MLDFHLHTDRSDGAMRPAELAAAVANGKVTIWAVTDHDTTAGWAELAGRPGLVPGVEATAGHHGREIHVVGLGFDPEHDGLQRLLDDIRLRRRARLAAIISGLPAGIRREVTVETLEDGRARTLGRNHLARALVAAGGVSTIGEAFREHLADEHVADPALPGFPPVLEVATAIRAAGGVAILAHPGCYRDPAYAVKLMREGLDGAELHTPGLDDATKRAVYDELHATGGYASAGTDLHFLGRRSPGMVKADDPHLARLRERLGV